MTLLLSKASYGAGWVTSPPSLFTESKVQSRRKRDNRWSCLMPKRFHSKAFSSVSAESIMAVF